MTTALSMDNLEELCDAEQQFTLPAELSLDPYHPDNDQHTQRERALMSMCVTQSKRCNRKHVRIANLFIAGLKNKTIAERVGLTPTTVSNVLKRNEIQQLLTYLRHLQRHRDGATINHRKSILYRIAIDNEKEKPNVAISALQEMNKMDHVYTTDEDKSTVNIVINSDVLPKTSLDVLPDHES